MARKHRELIAALLAFVAILASAASAKAEAAAAKVVASYALQKDALEAKREVLAIRFAASRPTAEDLQGIAQELTQDIEALSAQWLGSDWGRGQPQSELPQQGKTNCGTFVGTLLRDIGFVIDIKKLQRQPSQAIIRSFVGGARVKKLVGTTMQEFVAGVEKMGPGLYIIGLDQHVGLLIQSDSGLQYMHSSSETGKVAIENASEAWTIESSRYRVVGKILSPRNIRDWLQGRRIVVQGKY